MKNYILLLIMLISSIYAYLQEDRSKLIIISGIQSSDINIKTDSNIGDLSSKNSGNPNLQVGYEQYLSKRSNLSILLGYNSLTKYFLFDLNQDDRDFLKDEGLTWNDHIRIPRNQYFLSFEIGYVFHHFQNEKHRLSYCFSGRFNFAMKNNYKTYTASNLFYENTDDIFQTIGPTSYELHPDYNLLSFNPISAIRYERITKYGNSYGMVINFGIPLTIKYRSSLVILPEYPEINSSIDYYSRGGFIGLSVFYGIGFTKSINFKQYEN